MGRLVEPLSEHSGKYKSDHTSYLETHLRIQRSIVWFHPSRMVLLASYVKQRDQQQCHQSKFVVTVRTVCKKNCVWKTAIRKFLVFVLLSCSQYIVIIYTQHVHIMSWSILASMYKSAVQLQGSQPSLWLCTFCLLPVIIFPLASFKVKVCRMYWLQKWGKRYSTLWIGGAEIAMVALLICHKFLQVLRYFSCKDNCNVVCYSIVQADTTCGLSSSATFATKMP